VLVCGLDSSGLGYDSWRGFVNAVPKAKFVDDVGK